MSIFTQFDNNFGEGFYTSMGSVDGGVDILHDGNIMHQQPLQEGTFENGHWVIRNIDNNTGVVKTIIDGKLVNTAEANVHGGIMNIDSNGNVVNTTMPNGLGGEIIYDGHMQYLGQTFPSVMGMENYLAGHGNALNILHFNDPLAHSNEYISNPFDITGGGKK